MGGKYIVNQTAGSRVIILEENDESIQGGYFDTEGAWHDLEGPLDGNLEGRYVINETDGKRVVLLEEDAEKIGGGYFDIEGTWIPFGSSWVAVWDYTMGQPQDTEPFTRDQLKASNISLESNGLKITGTASSNTLVRYRVNEKPYTTNKGTVEVVFQQNISTGHFENLIIGIGNENNGIRINTNKFKFRLRDKDPDFEGTEIADCLNDTEYKVTVKLDGQTCSVSVNDQIVYTGPASGMHWANSVFVSVNAPMDPYYVILKSIKYKPEV